MHKLKSKPNPEEKVSKRRRVFCFLRRIATALLTFTLIGCAAQRLHEEGMNLVERGQVQEGLAKLNAASKSDPGNLSYRIDLIRTREHIIDGLLMNADAQRSAGNPEQANKLYQAVLQIDKKNTRAMTGLLNLQMDKRHAASMIQAKKLVDKHDYESAHNIVKSILLEDPTFTSARKLSRIIDRQLAKNAISGPILKPEFKKPVTLEFRDANLKMVVEALSRTSGLNILLDKDVRSDLKTTIFVKNASVEDTIDLIALQNGLNKKILSDNTVLIYPNTPAKVKEYQDLIIRSFQLTNADAKDMEKMLKALLKTRDMFVDKKTNSLIIRDTPDAIRLAEKLIASQDLAQPEVMLELEVMEVTRSKLTELGIKYPEEIALSAAGTPESTTVNTLPGGGVVTTTTPSKPLTLHDVSHLNNTFFTVSPLNASIDLKDESGDVNILASPRIRVRNREKAKILIGDRVPVITNAVTPVSTGAPVVTGNVQYLDAGLKLNVEPYIHADDEVEIKINLEVSSIVREISSGPTLAYQIGTRSANTVLRLKDGETQVLAGLISDEDRKAAQKFPGLGDLPVIGRLFSSHKNDAKKTEIVLSITPHLTRRNTRPNAMDTEFWSGTDSSLRSKPITLEQVQVGAAGQSNSLHKQKKVASLSPSAIAIPTMPVASVPPVTRQPAASRSSHTITSPPTQYIPFKRSSTSSSPLQLSWNSPKQSKVGKEFKVTIEAQADQPVSGLSFTLGFDGTALGVVSIAEGSLFKQQGKKTIFTSKVDPDTGHAFIYASRLGPPGVRGKGSIAVVTFSTRAKQAKSPIVITGAHAISSHGSKLPAPASTPLIVSLKP